MDGCKARIMPEETVVVFGRRGMAVFACDARAKAQTLVVTVNANNTIPVSTSVTISPANTLSISF
jgi:hypothetical protein